MSNADDPVRGVGAARNWILHEMQSYSPKLQVRFDKYRVKKQGQRIFQGCRFVQRGSLPAGEENAGDGGGGERTTIR